MAIGTFGEGTDSVREEGRLSYLIVREELVQPRIFLTSRRTLCRLMGLGHQIYSRGFFVFSSISLRGIIVLAGMRATSLCVERRHGFFEGVSFVVGDVLEVRAQISWEPSRCSIRLGRRFAHIVIFGTLHHQRTDLGRARNVAPGRPVRYTVLVGRDSLCLELINLAVGFVLGRSEARSILRGS